MSRIALAAGLAFLVACGSDSKKPKPIVHKVLIPARAETAGDDLLGYLPTGADVLFELDLRRLRENPVIGELVKSLKSGAGKLDPALLTKTDLVVLAAYNVGTAQAATLTLVRGETLSLADVKNSVKVTDNTFALGPAKLLAMLPTLKAGKTKSVKIDRKLLRTRALAMPPKATTGALRVSGSLDFDARVSLARTLSLDEVPATISIWGDVIDDLAVVGLLGGTEKGEAESIARAVTKWRGRLARNDVVRKLFLGPIVRRIDIRVAGSMARVVLLIGPKRLNRVTKRLKKDLK